MRRLFTCPRELQLLTELAFRDEEATEEDSRSQQALWEHVLRAGSVLIRVASLQLSR